MLDLPVRVPLPSLCPSLRWRREPDRPAATAPAGSTAPTSTAGATAELTAIPYAFWGNRTAGPMRVWIPLAG